MGTLLDYIEWRGDLPFSQVAINDVDSLIFSMLAYVPFEGIAEEAHGSEPISLQAAISSFFAKYPAPKDVPVWPIYSKQICKLLRAVRSKRRYRNVGVTGYVSYIDTEKQSQFSAVTFLLDSGDAVVSYRGTDDTLIGWKENFNMSFLDIVPAQIAARDYLNAAAEHLTGKLYLTGHSKGGNLSVFSAIHCAPHVKSRIAMAWCNDGPGFRREWLRDPAYLEIKARIRTLLPQSSLVGILLEHEENYTVVKSSQVGILQHDGLSWEVQGNAFVRIKEVSGDSRRVGLTFKNWIEELTVEQREQFCDAMYEIFTSDHALTLTDLVSLKNKWLIRGMKVEPEVREVLKKTVLALISAMIKAQKEMSALKEKR